MEAHRDPGRSEITYASQLRGKHRNRHSHRLPPAARVRLPSPDSRTSPSAPECARRPFRRTAGLTRVRCAAHRHDRRVSREARRSAARRLGEARLFIGGFDVAMVRARHRQQRHDLPKGFGLILHGLTLALVWHPGLHPGKGLIPFYSESSLARTHSAEAAKASRYHEQMSAPRSQTSNRSPLQLYRSRLSSEMLN